MLWLNRKFFWESGGGGLLEFGKPDGALFCSVNDSFLWASFLCTLCQYTFKTRLRRFCVGKKGFPIGITSRFLSRGL